MALVLQDRVQEIATANTTVSFTLVGAVTGFQSFSIIGNTNTTYYAATDTYGNWEVGIGTYSTTGPTLTRTTILSSSNAGSAVTFSSDSGAVNVFCTYPSERALYVDSAGTTFNAPNTVITSSSSADALRITQTGSGNALVVEDEANPDSTPFVIDTNGNIASGLSSTAVAMEIYRTSNASFRIDGDGTTSTVQARSFSNLPSTATVANFVRARGTKASSTIVQSGDLLSQYRGSGYDGSAFIQAGNIEFYVDGTPGVNDMPGRLVFNTTADGASSPTERMRIDNAGNVGIGTTSPTTKLHVRSDADALTVIEQIQNRNAGASAGGTIAFINSITDIVDNKYSYIGAITTGAAQNGNNLVFATNPNGSSAVERMRIDSTGNVIIGATSADTLITGSPFQILGDGAAANAGMARYQTGSLFSPSFTFYKTNGTKSAPTTVVSGDRMGLLSFNGYDGATFVPAARISAEVDGTPGTNDMPGRLIFSTTADGASTPTERMRIDNAGAVGIGSTALTGYNLRIGKNLIGATTALGVDVTSTIMSDVTVSGTGFRTQLTTEAASFTLGNITHYNSTQLTLGAGSTVTNQYGYIAGSTLTGATNNYGFYGNIASGTSRFNLYMAGSADNYMAGSLGIGTATITGNILRIAKTITGATGAAGISISSVTQSDVTSDARYYRTSVGTAAAAFTLPALNHFYAAQGTFGVGSVVTNQYGFQSEVNLTGATNNYSFYGSIPAPTSGITTTGTISSISSSGTTVTVNHNAITYTTGQTVTITATANATALTTNATCTILTVGTTDFTAIGAASNTVGVSFTASGAGTGTGTVTLNVQGSGRTVATPASGTFTYTTSTTQNFAAVTVTGSVIVSTRYNLYMAGTAPNYFAGDMQFNKTVTATGTTGARTIDKNAGTVNFAAAAASLVVTNSLVTANSIIICTVGTNDTTMKSVQAVAAAGSFTLYPSAAPTAETRVNFIVIN